jgi:primase-polymerase (primpol)-like protein
MKADARPDHLPKTLAPLIALAHWVIWRWETTKRGKNTKVPYQAARPNVKATSTDPRTWSDFATAAVAAKNADSIGFCLLNSDCGAFDIDHCRDAASGAIDPWAKALVARAGSYAEVTVSGTGLQIIGRATGSKLHRKQPVANGVTLETYRRAERYIVMTGDALPGSSMVLADLDAIMDAVVAELDAGVKHEDPAHHESPVRRLSTRRHIPRHARRSAGSLPVERRWAPNQDQQKRDMEN